MHGNLVHRSLLASVSILLAVSASGAPARTAALESQFRNPPPSARLHAYWFWMGPNMNDTMKTPNATSLAALLLAPLAVMMLTGHSLRHGSGRNSSSATWSKARSQTRC